MCAVLLKCPTSALPTWGIKGGEKPKGIRPVSYTHLINKLELLLFYAIPRRDTNPIAHRLLDRFGSLSAVLEAEPALLTEVDGISEHSCLLYTSRCV